MTNLVFENTQEGITDFLGSLNTRSISIDRIPLHENVVPFIVKFLGKDYGKLAIKDIKSNHPFDVEVTMLHDKSKNQIALKIDIPSIFNKITIIKDENNTENYEFKSRPITKFAQISYDTDLKDVVSLMETITNDYLNAIKETIANAVFEDIEAGVVIKKENSSIIVEHTMVIAQETDSKSVKVDFRNLMDLLY